MNPVILSSLLLFITSCCNSQVIEVREGVFFWRELTPQLFNFTGVTVGRTNVYYSISTQPFAGLPEWLNFYQRNRSSPGFLYGTPTSADVGTLNVQVIAVNRNLFESVKMILTLNIVENTAETDYSIDIFVANSNFDELLMGNSLTSLSSVMQQILQSPNLFVKDVVHPTFRGDSLPLPTGERQYEGVYVVFGNVQQDYEKAAYGSEDIMSVMQMCMRTIAELSNLPLNYQSTQPFIINWCKMMLIKRDSVNPTPDPQPAEMDISISSSDTAERNIAIVISFLVLSVVIIIVSFVLFYVCYNRYLAEKRVDGSGKKYKKQDIWKSAQSMVIANTQLELREMSVSTPPDSPSTPVLPSSPSSLFGRDKQMPDPPPYQYPPHLENFYRPSKNELKLEPATASTLL